MARKSKTKIEELKAGDIIVTDQGESIEIDAEAAASLNEQIKDEISEPEKLVAFTPKKVPAPKASKGTFRFKKFNKK